MATYSLTRQRVAIGGRSDQTNREVGVVRKREHETEGQKELTKNQCIVNWHAHDIARSQLPAGCCSATWGQGPHLEAAVDAVRASGRQDPSSQVDLAAQSAVRRGNPGLATIILLGGDVVVLVQNPGVGTSKQHQSPTAGTMTTIPVRETIVIGLISSFYAVAIEIWRSQPLEVRGPPPETAGSLARYVPVRRNR